MAKEVLITLRSIQWIDSEKSETELITAGTFEFVADESCKIIYKESAATGFEGSETALTCYGNKLVKLIRSGNSPSNLMIEMDKKHHCHYGTPYGEFIMGVHTHVIDNKLTEEGGDIYMKYTIDINSSYISDNEIYLNVK